MNGLLAKDLSEAASSVCLTDALKHAFDDTNSALFCEKG